MIKKLFFVFIFLIFLTHKCEALTLSSDGNEWIVASKVQKIAVCKEIMNKKGKDPAYWLTAIDLYYNSSGKYGLRQSIDKVSDMVSSENVY